MNYPEQTEVIDDIVDKIIADEEFVYFYEQDGVSAFQIIEETLHDALDPHISPAMYDDDFYYSQYPITCVK